MRAIELLTSTRSIWLSEVSHRLARSEAIRENLEQLLSRFFDLLRQAVETGNPGWIEPILDELVETRTQTDLENIDTSLSQMLNQILAVTFEVAHENLKPQDAIELFEAVLPYFSHATDYATRKEMLLQIEHISRELEKATRSLERLDRSKSDFIAIAAHELKTPLTLIEGYAAMLKDHVPKDEYSQAVVLLKGMDNGTRRLQEIVDDMIDVSLIDNNLLSLHFQPVWINRLLNVLEQEFRPVAEERNQSLEIMSFPGCDEMTFGDDERLFQALRNVLSNAIKYTPDGGKVVVDGRLLPGFIEVTIMDTGIGIDPEDHMLIFEKFGRLGSVSLHSSGKTKSKGGGPGLGLRITKGIIEAHGGAIWVESEGYSETEYPGCTFHILFPVRKSPPDDKTAKLFSPLTGANRD